MLVIILFVFSPCILAYDLYSEVEYLEGSCYPRDTCKLQRNENDDHLWGNYTCECGGHCLRYGTCCADSPHHGKMLHVEYRGERCQSLAPKTDPVVAVTRCSDRWRYEFLTREKCELVQKSQEDPFMVTPVTSLATHVTYKNYYCALCNYDAKNLSVWNIALKLTLKELKPGWPTITDDYFLENMVYEDGAWGVYLDCEFHKLKLLFEVPPSVRKFVKKCYPTMVTQCDASYVYDYDLQYKCLSYYSPISLVGNKYLPTIYRNVHCALCNGVNASSETDQDKCTLSIPGGSIVPPSSAKRPAKPSFSFALLLDINRSDGDLVGKKQLCDEGAKWDPFFKKCRTLACALPGYVVKDGQCVESGDIVWKRDHMT